MCILVSQNGSFRKHVEIFNSLQENDKKLTLLIFTIYTKLKVWQQIWS